MRPTKTPSWAEARGASGNTRQAATRSTASQDHFFRIALYLLLVILRHCNCSDTNVKNMPTLVYSNVSVSQRSQKCTLDVARRVCTGPGRAGTSAKDNRATPEGYYITSSSQSPHVECSAMSLDTHLLAHIQDRTDRAARTAPSTAVFPKRPQETVDLHPVLLWEHAFECGHGLFWSLPIPTSPALGYA